MAISKNKDEYVVDPNDGWVYYIKGKDAAVFEQYVNSNPAGAETVANNLCYRKLTKEQAYAKPKAKKQKPEPEPKPEPEVKEEPEEEPEEPTVPDYSSMTKDQLLAICKQKGIMARSNWKIETIIDKLQ